MPFVKSITGILYICLGILQFLAIMAGIQVWLGVHWLIAAFLAFLIAYLPIIGTIVGMFGAVAGWGWSWLLAGLLFLGPFLVIAFLAAGDQGFKTAISKMRTGRV